MQENSHNLYLTGGTGFIGAQLSKCWLSRSPAHRVVIQTRSPSAHQDSEGVHYVSSPLEVKDWRFDVLVNLAGAPIADKRWSDRRKTELLQSRVDLTTKLGQQFGANLPQVVISTSAIGYYGVRDGICDENSAAGSGFAADLCQQWESAAKSIVVDDTRLCIMRLGVVLGQQGALLKLAPMFRLGLGGPIGSGDQWFSWVHIDDAVNALLAAIDNHDWRGTFNLTAPELLRQRDFAKALGRALHRPAILPTPSWAMKAVFGQMAEELLLGGQAVEPKALLEKGFKFTSPEIDTALSAVFRG